MGVLFLQHESNPVTLNLLTHYIDDASVNRVNTELSFVCLVCLLGFEGFEKKQIAINIQFVCATITKNEGE